MDVANVVVPYSRIDVFWIFCRVDGVRREKS
jgi:hypothetical protein